MQYLFGEFRHKIDAKNRLSLPSDFRKALPDVLMVTQSPKRDEDCLYVYDIDGFGEWVDSLFAKDGGFSPGSKRWPGAPPQGPCPFFFSFFVFFFFFRGFV